MLSASTSIPCSSMARMRSCPMTREWGSTFSPISAIASGTAQCACTSTVFTRRPFTATSRRRIVPPACARASRALRRSQPTKPMPAIAPAAFRMNSLRVDIAPPILVSSLRSRLRTNKVVSGKRREARIVHGTAGGEVVQALPRVPPQAEQRVHLVVEKAADPGGADAGGLGLEVQHLPEHSALPIERSIAPRLAHRYLVMGEHPQRIAGVGGDVLVTADEPRSALQIIGDEQIKRQLGRADLVPQPVGPKRCFQRRERRRIPHKHVE